MKHLFTLILFALFNSFIFSQTTILAETFRTGSLPSGWSQTSVTFETTAGGYANFTSTNAVITSPIIDLSDYTNVELTFSVAKFGTGGDGPITVEISNDGGSTWTAQVFNSPTPTSSTYQTSGPTAITVSGNNVVIRFIRVNSPSQKRFRDFDLTGDVVMPVEFSKFSATSSKNTSIISFATASETNNNFFSIERSSDGTSFDAIGEIKGAGNSNTTLSYEFTDERPFAGINYYRIKQTDYDGKFSYTDIKSVRHNMYGNLSITPRTTEGRLQITTDAEDYTLDVYNVAGQQVKSYSSLSLDQSISIDELTAGLYYIKVNVGGQVETTKIVKL